MAALQSHFIKRKLRRGRLSQPVSIGTEVSNELSGVLAFIKKKNHKIKGTVSKFLLFWQTNLATLIRGESKKNLAGSLLKSKGCAHVSASLRRFATAKWLASSLQAQLCRKGWKRSIRERNEIWIEVWLESSGIFQEGKHLQKILRDIFLHLRNKWIIQWVPLRRAKIFYSEHLLLKKKSVMIFRKIYNKNGYNFFPISWHAFHTSKGALWWIIR